MKPLTLIERRETMSMEETRETERKRYEAILWGISNIFEFGDPEVEVTSMKDGWIKVDLVNLWRFEANPETRKIRDTVESLFEKETDLIRPLRDWEIEILSFALDRDDFDEKDFTFEDVGIKFDDI